MATEVTHNPPAAAESKSARKKKAKAAEAVKDLVDTHKERSGSQASLDVGGVKEGSEAGHESSAVKDLQKQIRNVNKKLTLMQKVDNIIAANPGKTLDELVTLKIINADQKAQALKKPSLISQRTALEDQIAQYKKFEAEYQDVFSKERNQLKSSHAKELEDVRDAVRKEVKSQMEKEFKLRLLVFARFLKAAAERRQREGDDGGDEGKAFEGVLYGIYTGDAAAVECAERLIEGVEEKVVDYSGVIDVTYARVKQLSLQESPIPNEDPWANDDDDDEILPSSKSVPSYQDDPTITHAGLTEDATTIIPNGANGAHDDDNSLDSPNAPPHASYLGDAGNAAAEERWDTKVPGEVGGMDESFEMVPRDPQEVENSGGNNPALQGSTQSWADETSAAAEVGEAAPAGVNGDGFQEVASSRGKGSRATGGRGGRGAPRGARGARGEFRGRGRGEGGFRGEGRGKGRGGGGARGGRGESS